MKCVRLGSTVKRVQESEAVKLVGEGWAYCPRSEWKKVRPAVSVLPPSGKKKGKKKKIATPAEMVATVEVEGDLQ